MDTEAIRAQAYAEGFAAGLEKAAKVAETCGVSGSITHKARNDIAAAIRALEPGE